MTTTEEIERPLDDNRIWLKDKITLREVNGSSIEITTPYLDRHKDTLQFYARAEIHPVPWSRREAAMDLAA